MDTLTSTCLHPFKKSAINVNRRSKGSLDRNINFEIFEEMNNRHPKKKIPTQDKKILKRHEIDNEFGDIYFNVFRKTIDEKRSTIPRVIVFFRLGKDVIKNSLGENLSSESIILHFFILDKGMIIIVVKQTGGSIRRFILRIFKIFKVIVVYISTLA